MVYVMILSVVHKPSGVKSKKQLRGPVKENNFKSITSDIPSTKQQMSPTLNFSNTGSLFSTLC
jgi:hypothetical protein